MLFVLLTSGLMKRIKQCKEYEKEQERKATKKRTHSHCYCASAQLVYRMLVMHNQLATQRQDKPTKRQTVVTQLTDVVSHRLSCRRQTKERGETEKKGNTPGLKGSSNTDCSRAIESNLLFTSDARALFIPYHFHRHRHSLRHRHRVRHRQLCLSFVSTVFVIVIVSLGM